MSTPFGAALQAAITASQVPVKTLVTRSGIGQSTVYAYLAGRRNPSADNIDALAAALRADASTRRRLHAAAGYEVNDLPTLAADIVRSLSSDQARLAVELLRTQARVQRAGRAPDAAPMTSPTPIGRRRAEVAMDATLDDIEGTTPTGVDPPPSGGRRPPGPRRGRGGGR